MNIKSGALNQSASKDRDSHINLLYVNLSLLLSHLHIKKSIVILSTSCFR